MIIPDEVAALVKRLREEQKNVIRYRQSLGAEGDYLFQEAADALESLSPPAGKMRMLEEDRQAILNCCKKITDRINAYFSERAALSARERKE